MIIFNDIQDVEDWVGPMSYCELWDAVRPYAVFSEADRDHCDGLIAGGRVKQDLILSCLKTIVRLDLTDKFDLEHRIYEPMDRQYLRSTH